MSNETKDCVKLLIIYIAVMGMMWFIATVILVRTSEQRILQRLEQCNEG